MSQPAACFRPGHVGTVKITAIDRIRVKLAKRSDFNLSFTSAPLPWLLGPHLPPVAARSDARKKLGRPRINTPGGGSQPRERPHPRRQQPLALWIGEPRQSPKMSPIRARRVPVEPFDERLRRPRAHRRFEDLAVIQPRLEVIGRGLHDKGRLESFHFHPLDRFRTKVVDEAQTVSSRRPDIDMAALRVFVAEPLDGCLDLAGTLPFPQNHLAGVTLYANVETLAAHRAKLAPHQPLDDHG
jgi:hypothetical protein